MSIAKDLARTRALRLRLASNPDQFAARGEPWRMPPEEGAQLNAAKSTRIRRAPGQTAKERPVFVEPKRTVPVSEKSMQMRYQREVLKTMLSAGDGNPSRTLANPATPEDRANFLRIHTDLHFSDQPFAEKRRVAERNDYALWWVHALEARDHSEWVAKERERIAEERAKRPHDRRLWPIV